MARVKYDVRGVESGERPVLPAGVHTGKITQADITKPDGKDQRIELIVTVSKNGTNFPLYEYVNLESETAKWKLRELLEAVGITSGKKGESGALDTDKMLLGKSIGVKTFIRPADDARGFDEQARIRRMFKVDEAAEDEDIPEEEESEDEAEGDETEYDDMSLAELRKEAKSRGIKTVRLKADEIIDKLVEWDEENAEGDEPEEEEPEDEDEAEAEAEAEEDEEPEDDYEEWSLEDLRTELKDRSLATKGGKKVMITRLRRDDAEGDDPF